MSVLNIPDVLRPPASIRVVTDRGVLDLSAHGDVWHGNGVRVTLKPEDDAGVAVMLAATVGVRSIELTWQGSTEAVERVLNDQWERSYGDLAWRAPDAARRLPWYALLKTPAGTHGIGVRTGPACFAAWRVRPDGLSLECDVRSGGVPVELGDRELNCCSVIMRSGDSGETAFQAARAFCRRMCSAPVRTDHVVYGFNDWYYAYGKNSPAGLLADASLLAELTAGLPNRPYCVIDDGWQTKSPTALGQWSETRPPFSSMAELAAQMKALDVRPGLWMRPLLDEINAWPAEWRLSRRQDVLDPTRPEVLEVVSADIRRITEWGYELIKHDFSTYDLLGDWGPKMADSVTPDGWAFSERTHTTAEVIDRLYATIQEAAGRAVVIGCNTVSHLTAGRFALNRIGDDTSGIDWSRNPKMGVNTLAFRGVHQDAFYGADADCAPITTGIAWEKLERWLDLLSRSGTPLFVSVDRAAVTPAVRTALRDALSRASGPLPLAEPLDWLKTATPERWKFGQETLTYDWSE